MTWRETEATTAGNGGNIDKPKKRLVKGGKSAGRWEVDFGIDEIGVRRRPTFATEADAVAAITTWEKEAKGRGEFWARLPVLERKSIAVAYQEIRLKGLTLAQVWADHQRWAKDLQQVAKEIKAYEDVVTEWKQRKRAAGKDERYINEASGMLLEFGQGRLRQNIHEIRAKNLEEWINGHESWGQSSVLLRQACGGSKNPFASRARWGRKGARGGQPGAFGLVQPVSAAGRACL